MPSSEKVVSPGVFTNEIDQSFLPAAVGEIGAAIVGPTVKGPAGVPTIVNSYSEFQAMFGDAFLSGSDYYTYMTSLTAKQYLKNGPSLIVTRILPTGYSNSVSTVSGSISLTGLSYSTGSLVLNPPSASHASTNQRLEGLSINIGATSFKFVNNSSIFTNTTSEIFVQSGSTLQSSAERLSMAIGSSSIHGMNISASARSMPLAAGVNAGFYLAISGTVAGSVGNITGSVTDPGGEITNPENIAYWTQTGYGRGPASVDNYRHKLGTALTGESYAIQGGTDSSTKVNAFKLRTIGDGTVNNSAGKEATSNILPSGSKNNMRWEISSKNQNMGTFSLLIRRGDDTIKRKTILETWNNLSLDPNTNNYVEKVIGNSKAVLSDAGTSDPYIGYSGSYANKSKYVYVSDVNQTVDYLDANGSIRVPSETGSLPQTGSGSFTGGSDGGTNFSHPQSFYTSISNTNTQGLNLGTAATGKTAYEDALNVLRNQDAYDFNLLLLPGLIDNFSNHSSVITKAIDVCENRGDCFVIADPVEHKGALTTAQTVAESRDSNYAAMYWPWIQIPDDEVGTTRWVPASVALGGIYAFNDKVAQPWFAPAGLNRGGIDVAIKAERKLTQANRDSLYESNVNPIATFPGQGVVVWGQKTLQKKPSALDRVNVRRLMIKVKKFIASSSRFLVFEQNNTATRRRFLNIVNPYLEQIQAGSGLSAFRVVMDDSNNTPDVVDRNILYGQIFVQPTRTAEFIVLDFTIQPTGATFPE